MGENAQKRLDDDFEYRVMAELLRKGEAVLLDRGAGGEEAARVDRLVERLGSPAHLHLHDGSYASFASHIMQSRLYVGYDSAGQHVAAAADVPLVSLFKGFVSDRMLARWRPEGRNVQVVIVDDQTEDSAASRMLAAIAVAEEAALGSPKGSSRN